MPLNKSSELRKRLSRANHKSNDSSTEQSSANTTPNHETEMVDDYEPVLQIEDPDVVELEPQQMISVTIPSSQIAPADDLLCVTPDTTVNRIPASSKQIRNTIKQGEEKMAEVDTTMLSGQHADIRREAAMNTADIRREIATSADQVADITLEQAGNVRREAAAGFGETRYDTAIGFNEAIKESIKGDWHNSGAIKDARYDVATRVEDAADRVRSDINNGMASLTNQFFTVSRDTADLRAQVIQAIDTTKMATELNALKGIIEGQKNTAYLSDKITADGEKTRDLISDLKYHDLSRGLIERNNELVEERNWGRHWYHGANQAQFGQQFAQLQSQMQNFNSQLSETRQGMVNFGTMAGVGQTSSANNVR